MNNKKKRTVKSTMYIRIVCGLYLLYTDYSLLSKWESIKADNNQIIMAVVITLFAIAGIVMIIYSSIKLLRQNKEHKQQDVIEDTEIKDQSK